MARLWQCGFELGTLNTGVEVTTSGGTVSVQSTVARTGTYALHVNPAANTGFVRYHPFTTDQTIVGYQRFYLRIDTLPSASTYICRFADTANNPCAAIRLTTAGKLQLYKADTTQLGSDSPTLSTGVWYRIELKCDSTTNPGAIDARLDGVSFASGSNSAQAPWSRILLGVITTSATTDLYFDDWACNDGSGASQNSWCGDGKIIHLTPNAAGDANGWNNTSNGAGSSTNYQLVDEIPPNDATDYVRAATLNTEDSYNLSASGIGASDTVNCVMVGMRLSNVTADAATGVTTQIKKTSGGTVAQGTEIRPNSTTWSTNRPAEPRSYTLTTYADPDGNPWTQSTLDTAQAGIKITNAGTNQIRVSTLWVSVDYTPSTGGATVNGTAAANLGGLSATVAGKRTVHGTAAATASFTGTVAGKPTVRGAAATSAALTATAAGKPTVHGTASTGISFAAAASGEGIVPGTASAAFTAAASAVGDRTVHGVAAAASSLAAAATGAPKVSGIASAALIATATASGTLQVRGAASAPLGGLMASATAKRVVKATAGTAVTTSATASADVTVHGTADASASFTAHANVLPVVEGTATANLGGLTAGVVGRRTVNGSVASSLGPLAAKATGRRVVDGAATAALGGLTATATGRRAVRGGCSVTIQLGAAGAGRVGVHGAANSVIAFTASATGGNPASDITVTVGPLARGWGTGELARGWSVGAPTT